MNRNDFEKLSAYKEFLNPASSFVRMSTREFSEIEAIWTSITGVKETFNHSCGKCNLDFIHKVARAYHDFAEQVQQEPEPKPVATTVSEVKKNNTPKKVTNRDTKDGRNKKNNTKKA